MLLFADAQYTSPYAMSVFVALTEKRIPFELKTVDLVAGANRGGEYAARSLTQRVPTLVDGDFTLSESSAITEYLEELQPEPALYPADLKTRALARQVQAWIRSDLLPIRQERSTYVVFYGPSDAPLSAGARDAAGKLFKAAQALLAHGGEHLFGAWSIADVDLALMLNRLVLNGDEVPPVLREFARRQWDRESVQAWVNLARPPM
ncbi:glutathione transferase [Pseudoduganella umbonata]|uniref:Glutathione S-transferase n=1 Tax=Pseudoduganella umbonata TaxID=864828 RepID=A0A4P8HQV0_9BURK|nr:glutathione transferase [Pseudoduganella umbonata]MBB3225348.1 glutathione S-transferase [Pseudoduganella umbonata]QCP11546.1 glutathione transferase [Pseudoduganella umbonata]